MRCFDGTRPADWSGNVVQTEHGLLIGQDMLFRQNQASDRPRHVVQTEPDLLIGRDMLFRQNLAS